MPNNDVFFFSIIIPLFNSENTLAENLRSIAAQTFTNYEIIFTDNASTDETLKIVSDFQAANKHIRLKLSSEPDRGIYDAMNKGVALAEGQWLYFMGSDDRFYSPSVLSLVDAEIAKEYADLVYGNVQGISSNIRYVYDTLPKVLATGIHHQSVFYRSLLFRDLGGYDLRYKIASDYHFTLKVFLNSRYITRYADLDIAYYGEGGYSARHFDYKLFSGHYRLLAKGHKIEALENPEKCLHDSIYCCLYLAGEKQSLVTAWSNLLYYITTVKRLHLSFRLKTFVRMLMWTVAPPRKISL
jgi:glycosyltransferase involved in cell wall biosynthesis